MKQRGGGEENRRDREEARCTMDPVEVSLTILRNFADSLAHVDHVRPATLPREARVVSSGCPKICIRDGQTPRGT